MNTVLSTESAFVLQYPEIEMPRRFKVHVFTFLFQNQEGGCVTIHNREGNERAHLRYTLSLPHYSMRFTKVFSS